MKRFFTLVFFLIVLHIPYSCIDEDDCGSFAELESRITEVTSTVGSFDSEDFVDFQSDSFNTAAIKIEITEMEFTEVSHTPIEQPSLFINQAYACSPPEPQLAYTITDIELTGKLAVSLNGEDLSGGTPLNDLFKVVDHNNISLSEFLEKLRNDPWLLNYVGAGFTIALIDKPDRPINQKLHIRFGFSDGTFIKTETDVFKAG